MMLAFQATVFCLVTIGWFGIGFWMQSDSANFAVKTGGPQGLFIWAAQPFYVVMTMAAPFMGAVASRLT